MKKVICTAICITILFCVAFTVAAADTVTPTTREIFSPFWVRWTSGTTGEVLAINAHSVNDMVAYCLQWKKSGSSTAEYSEMTDYRDIFSATTLRGIEIIIENGYPRSTGGLSSQNGYSAEQMARCATQVAIWCWIAEQEYRETGEYPNSYPAGNLTKATLVTARSALHTSTVTWMRSLVELARAQAAVSHTITASAATPILNDDGNFCVTTEITLDNCDQGYVFVRSTLPNYTISVNGEVIDPSSFVGADGDTVSITFDRSVETVGNEFSIQLDAYDDSVENKLIYYEPVSEDLQQMVVYSINPPAASASTTLTFTAPDTRQVQLLLTDEDAGQAIPYFKGTEFGLYDSTGTTLLETLLIGEDGYSNLSGYFPVGEYILKATSSINGYEKLEDIPVSITASSGLVVAIENSLCAIKGTIRITATGESVNLVNGSWSYGQAPLPKASFTISAGEDILKPDGTLVYAKGSVVTTITTLDDGTNVSGKLYPGTYSVKQTASPSGFILDAATVTVTITINEENTATTFNLKYHNKHQKAKFSLHVLNEFFDPQDSHNPSYSMADGSDLLFGLFLSNGKQVTALRSSAAGLITYTAYVPAGEYYWQQLETPDRYIVNTQKYPVSVKYTGNSPSPKVVGVIEAENRLITETLTITKTDTENNPLPGAEITVADSNGTISYVGTTNEVGQITAVLPVGNYTYTESKAPATYAINRETYPCEVISSKARSAGYVIVDEPITLRFLCVAEDGTPVNDIAFTLFDSNNVPVDTIHPNGDGSFNISHLPIGTYTLVETATPTGFVSLGTIGGFEITDTYQNGELVTIVSQKIVIPKTGDTPLKTIFLILICLGLAGSISVLLFSRIIIERREKYGKSKEHK